MKNHISYICSVILGITMLSCETSVCMFRNPTKPSKKKMTKNAFIVARSLSKKEENNVLALPDAELVRKQIPFPQGNDFGKFSREIREQLEPRTFSDWGSEIYRVIRFPDVDDRCCVMHCVTRSKHRIVPKLALYSTSCFARQALWNDHPDIHDEMIKKFNGRNRFCVAGLTPDSRTIKFISPTIAGSRGFIEEHENDPRVY